MKKSIIIMLAAIAFVATSCKKEKIEGTATQEASGQWSVALNCIDDEGNAMGDLFGVGQFLILTYNTNDDAPDKIYIDDLGNFWAFKVKADLDLQNLTFSVQEGISEFVDDEGPYDIAVTITNGKILKGAATTPSGMPADSIVFDILFEDDEYVGVYYDHMRIEGFRYTGFANDELF